MTQLPDGLWEQTLAGITEIERQMKRSFGGETKPGNHGGLPLLVSVRSGAKFSMPGMMDTILNLGLSPASLAGLIAETGDERFAYDCMRRLIQMFGKVVLEVNSELFEDAIDRVKRRLNVTSDTEIPAEDLQRLADEFRAMSKRESGMDFPDDPTDQLRMAVEAVFRSWNNTRAIRYRRQNNIPDDLGTAVNVQSMVYGNLGDDCATGVCFTRNPNTGERGFLVNTCRTRKVRMSLPGCGRRSLLPGWATMPPSRRRTASSSILPTVWSAITVTCRTLSSRSSTANSICSKHVTASGQVRRQ